MFLTIYTFILLFDLINLNIVFSISFNMYDSETITCFMLGNDCWVQLAGISVGHRFYSRAEMVAVGFHSHWLNGIDYMGQSYRKGVSINFICTVTIFLILSYLPWMSGRCMIMFCFLFFFISSSWIVQFPMICRIGTAFWGSSQWTFYFVNIVGFGMGEGSYSMEMSCVLYCLVYLDGLQITSS